jgi:hypothetical protein
MRTREEPYLETQWFKNKETMEKVQNLKSSNTFIIIMEGTAIATVI